jgi:vanadium-dependent haloperoxidase-like protein
VLSWLGPDKGWGMVDGSQWRPYQHVTVLTPAFPEYVSGHSTFSSAGTKILQNFTGGDTFNAYVTVEKGSSKFEANTPAMDIRFQWPTFTSSLDDAGLSRRLGGIHFISGDAHGRALGTQIGNFDWAKAQQYINGSVPG